MFVICGSLRNVPQRKESQHDFVASTETNEMFQQNNAISSLCQHDSLVF